MGASGAGKTTLLDVLAGRKTQGRMQGSILVNGYDKDAATFPRIAGYVEQTDNHISSATVFETLLFSARMRLPAETPEATRVSFVEEVMDILELTDIRNRLIGDADEVSLSPGQLKRVTIGVELVANPAILFLDEPTTGLDSRGAQTVVRVIRRVAARGRAVVCTIHQPSAELFYMFDRLLLLQAGGYQVYFGPIGHRGREIVRYFEKIPGALKRPPRVNVASWMLEVIGAGTGAKKEDADKAAAIELEMADAATRTATRRATTAHTRALSSIHIVGEEKVAPPPSPKSVSLVRLPSVTAVSPVLVAGEEAPIHLPTIYAELYKTRQLIANQPNQDQSNSLHPELARVTAYGYARGWWTQLALLLERAFTSHWRNTAFNFTRFLVVLFLGILFGLNYVTWHGDAGQQSSVTSRISSIFATAAFNGVIHAANALPVIFRQRAVFYREKSSQSYAAGAYSAQLFIREIPYIAVASMLFLIPYYFMSSFKNDSGVFFAYWFGQFVSSMAFYSISILLSAAMPNQMLAEVAQGFYLNLAFLFGGIFIPSPSIPRGWIWLYEMNPVRQVTEALTMPQYECNSGASCPKILSVTAAGTSEMYTHDFVSSYYDWNYGSYWSNIGWLFFFAALVNIVAVLYTKYRSHVKR
jgi:ABC-type multidrug transport system ATPase subunit